MAKRNERFEFVYSQGQLKGANIIVDKETGINYLYVFNGYGGGVTPLLDSSGRPVVSPRYYGESDDR